MRNVLIAAISFALGVASHFAYVRSSQTQAAKIEQHWLAIERYKEFVEDPANLESLGDGFLGFSDPPYPQPHLVALAALGEIEHVDLVLPMAPNTRAAKQHWMRFVQQHDDIIYSMGNTSYNAFTPSGDQPLHLEFWYLPTAETEIQNLIRELESMRPDSGEP